MEQNQKWVEDGGFLVIEGGFLKDECNNIDLSLWIKGLSSKEITRQDKIGRLPIELPVQKLIDLTQPIYFPVVCSK